MTIENCFYRFFLFTFVDSINVFDCPLPDVIKKVYGFCVFTGDDPHLSLYYGHAYGISKVLAIKKPSFIFIGSVHVYANIILCKHYLSHIHRGKDACDLGEGVPSSTLSTKAWSPSPA